MSDKRLQSKIIYQRREYVFLGFGAIFIATLAMLNVIGITRFIDMSFTVLGVEIPMIIAVGVLPYPVTFFCTDMISELFGHKKARLLVYLGFLVNIWVMFVIWLGGVLPGVDAQGGACAGVYQRISELAFGAVAASLTAYAVAQLADVAIFHWSRKQTGHRYLWVRSILSTSVSQLLDTITVILVTHYYAHALPINAQKPLLEQLLMYVASGYGYKFICGVLDTSLLYVLIPHLRRYCSLSEQHQDGEAQDDFSYRIKE